MQLGAVQCHISTTIAPLNFGMQVGNERMSSALEWSGQKAFASEPLREWSIGDAGVGLTRSSGPFTFATIYGAGHMVRLLHPLLSRKH